MKLSAAGAVKLSKPLHLEVIMTKKWLVVGGLGIAVLAVCAASVVAALPVVRLGLEGNIQWNLFSNTKLSADAVEEQRAAVDGPADLKVNTPFGKVDITAKEGSQEIVISAHKYAWGGTKQAAEDLLKKVKVVVKQNGNSINVYVDQPMEVDIFHIGPAGISVDFTISTPTDCSVDASSSSGDIRLVGTSGDATLHSNFGKVTAEKIQGGLKADSSSGDVVVKDISASEKSVEATSSFGEVLVQNSKGGDLTVKSRSGDVSVENSSFTWNAGITSDFGEVQVTALKARSLNARANSGKVRLQSLEIQNDLIAHSDFGDVEVKKSSAGSYDLDVNSGEVTVEDAQGKVKARSGFGDVNVSGTNVVLDLSTNSGSISFTGSLGDGVSILHTSFGDIKVLLPEDAQFLVDLSTNFGDIHCGFAVTPNPEDSTHLVGKVGEGGPTLKASTNSGNVNVYPQTPVEKIR
jgi:DUF4097 and DUF4098 domain-containing protein YvlB